MESNYVIDNTYRVLHEIDRGGTGVVYLAYHLRLQKYVVVKRIKAEYRDVKTLRKEADLLKNLHHEFLPQVYDYLIVDGQVFTVMDYIKGQNLSELSVEAGTISEQRLLKWFRQLAQVLDYLHTRLIPILHSDIKPENIILTEEDNICLIDFNISLDGESGRKPTGFSRNYASPEQLWMAKSIMSGSPVDWELDASMDIYSSGATFYSLITGILPTGEQINPPLSGREDFPYSPGFLAVVDKCMAWERDKRYSTAAKLLTALENVKKQDKRYKRWLLAQAAAIAGSAVLTAFGVILLVSGIRTLQFESLTSDYLYFTAAVDTHGSAEVLQLGQELLEDAKYADMLQKDRVKKSFVLHSLGNASLEEGNLSDSVYYYGQAIAVCEPGDENLGTYYYDYALALLDIGREEEARAALEKGIASVEDTGVLLLLEAEIAFLLGDTEGCVETVREILNSDSGGTYSARACLIAASALGYTSEEGLGWLKKASEYERSIRDLRESAAGFLSAAQEAEGMPEEKELIQEALDAYEELSARPYPSFEDRLGLAVSFYADEQFERCIETLMSCKSDGEQDYRIDMYLAYANLELGRSADATDFCADALEKIEKTFNPTNPEALQDDWDSLLELQRVLENSR